MDCSRFCFCHRIHPLSLIQPMDQTVIQSLKKRYRKELLRGIVLSEPDGGDLASQLKSINLKDYCYMIAQVWESISGNTLRVSWNKLLGYNEECLGDDDTPFFETLTDDEILEAVNKDEDKDGDESDMSDKSNERLIHSEAYSFFKFSLKWMEQQKEFNAAQLW
ncbi:Jerky -like protein-like [Trichinella spiralis]|uniref:Jerky-like protein-like n=1 Tax=Trichinella spiralis TaxID=6334 RepID=A0A0V1BX71_TRISP|nr:Jerky -like protein-like [Trichinella spiralis]